MQESLDSSSEISLSHHSSDVTPDRQSVAVLDAAESASNPETAKEAKLQRAREKARKKVALAQKHRNMVYSVLNNFCPVSGIPSSVDVVIVLWLASIVDVCSSFLYLCDIFSYLKRCLSSLAFTGSPLSIVLTTLFVAEDVLSIYGENWSTERGLTRVIFFLVDILILSMIYMYFVFDFASEHNARIWGSLIIIAKMVRSYKVTTHTHPHR